MLINLIEKLSILLLLLPQSGIAWNAVGHCVVAQIAYEHLNQKARDKIDQLTEIMDKGYSADQRFCYVATWPDRIAAGGITAYSHWHYIDRPFSTDGTPLKPASEENVVWAISQSEAVLMNAQLSDTDKVQFLQFLSFLVHFVGDVHQPLHNIELYSAAYPTGDGGGNLYSVKDENVNNLHAFWDEGLGLLEPYTPGSYVPPREEIEKFAQEIQGNYPESYFNGLTNDLNPQDWSDEGFTIAQSFVYQMEADTAPSAQYIQEGQQIVERRLALAGYRLANLLNKIFGQGNLYSYLHNHYHLHKGSL